MLTLEDLTGIEEEKKKQVVECLDSLAHFKTEQGKLTPLLQVIIGITCFLSQVESLLYLIFMKRLCIKRRC